MPLPINNIRTILGIVILSWIPLAFIGLAIYFAYDPLGTVKYEDLQTPEERERYHKKFTEIWASRLQWTFWYFKDNKMKEAVSEMACKIRFYILSRVQLMQVQRSVTNLNFFQHSSVYCSDRQISFCTI